MSFRNSQSVFMLGFALLFLVFIPTNLSAQAPPANASALENASSVEVVRQMGLGWNLGNTLEACGAWIKGPSVSSFETAWGNPQTTKEMIDAIKAAGFKSVRIPVAWSNMMGDDYEISPMLMDRVKEVVNYVLNDGMIAVVNIHWDGGWWSKFPTEYDESMKRYKKMWSQIAETFKDYPCSLIFESLNEEGCFNDVWNRWGKPEPVKKLKAFGILNNINQAFVDLVRKSGGLNSKRHLLIAGYATDIDLTVDPDFVMPKDPENHLIVSVHYYTPYTFAGLDHDESWGKARPTWGTKEDFAELETNMQKLKPRFLDQGIPVIVGEYGATLKTKEIESVRRYILAVAGKVYGMGMCPMFWDPGAHFNRRTLVFNDPDLLDGFQRIMSGEKVDEVGNNPTPEAAASFSSSIPEDILQQARKNADSPEGINYEKQFSGSVGEDLGGYMRVCTRDTPQAKDFLIVLKIERNGKVSGVYAGQDDPIAGCVARKLADEKCPRPPLGPYYELIDMKLKE